MIVCFPHPPGAGGPGSFQSRFEKKLISLGWRVVYRGEKIKPDLIFVVGGTRHIFWLFRMKIYGVPVLFRLDGISWLHRKKKVGLKKYILAEYRNCCNKAIHAFIADKIVYQSLFVKAWWDTEGWRIRKKTSIIYNGISLPENLPKDYPVKFSNRLVILEGNIDYSPYAIQLLNDLAVKLPEEIDIILHGKFEFKINRSKLVKRINYNGFLPRDKVNQALFGSVYLSLDINPACPNTVIEALACGSPVVAFDTGSIKELVLSDEGIIVSYGSDPWKLGYPDVDALVTAIMKVQKKYIYYSENARIAAAQRFCIDNMTEKYINLMYSLINK